MDGACGDCSSLVPQKADDYIEVEVKMDEMDSTAAESKATYEKIKDYALEHSGLKVIACISLS